MDINTIPAQGAVHSCGACCTRLTEFGVTLRGVPVLEHINLHMHCGELTAIIGPNGAGKTSLLRAMIGEIPHAGSLRFIHHGNVENTQPLRIGYVPQRLEIDRTSPTTVLDLFVGALSRWPLWLGVRTQTRQEARGQLAVVGADTLIDRKLSELSGGQLQRVLLALALAPNPELLLLDEPVAGLDQAGTELFYQTVSRMRTQYDLSILLVSHDLMAAASVADRMILLNRTILCDGTPQDVLGDPLLKQTFGFSIAGQDLPRRREESQRLAREQCELPEGGVK
jgi:zinc transport system ATP-binding protein